LQRGDFGIQLGQRAAHGGGQLLAFLGERDVARVAHEKLEAQRLFQLLDLQADGGRRLVQLLGGQFETPARRAIEIEEAGQGAQRFGHGQAFLTLMAKITRLITLGSGRKYNPYAAKTP
jgi:hypothetical protein